LLPHLGRLVIDGISADAGVVQMHGHARAATARCRRCGQESARVHSRYERTVADVALGGRPVLIRLGVRRFFCDNAECAAVTFAEQLPDLAARYARRTALLRGVLESIAVALAGRAGARLAARVGIAVSRASLLRLIRRLPDPEFETVPVLGVDDFAIRRRHRYGTVLVDMATRRPIDLLADREAETFAAWLRAHPGCEVICRDRAGGYADGARTGAPEAIQVADRWHLWHNLGHAVEKTVAAHRVCLREPAQAEDGAAPSEAALAGESPAPSEPVESRLVTRTRNRYAAVQSLLDKGYSISAITRELGLERNTVRRFARASGLDELLAKSTGRGTLLDPFKAYLHRRWNAGITDAAALYAEIRADGYRGSAQTVRRYLHPFRATCTAPIAVHQPPKVRHLTGWIMTDPEHLGADEHVQLKDARARCEHLDALTSHVSEFAKILTRLRGERLDAWIEHVNAHDLPALHSFTAGLKTDRDAVLNGLTMPHNSGPVEGNVNHIKMIKRQMYGRAKFDLLRKRVLLAT
jgi:transposase